MERLNIPRNYSPTEVSIHTVRYLAAEKLCNGKNVLDISCGEGYGSTLIHTRFGAKSVLGVDIDLEAINTANKIFKSESVEFLCCSIENLEETLAGRTFDTIVSCETIEHLDDPAGFLKLVNRLWTGNGSIYITCPNDYLYFGRGKSLNQYHKHEYSWLQFRDFSEGILGPAQWAFGTLASGFSIFPQELLKNVPQSNTEAVNKLASGSLLIAQPSDRQQLLAHNSLFYVGVWGGQPAAAVTTYPLSPEHRMPDTFPAPPSLRSGKRPRLVLVADLEGWAFCNIANNIKRYLGDRFEITILYQDHYEDWTETIFKALFELKADFIHYFWRETPLNFLATPWVISSALNWRGITPWQYSSRVSETVITTSVYDHLFLEQDQINVRASKYSMLDGYSTSSHRLRQIYARAYEVTPDVVIEDGVDLELFQPMALERFESPEHRPLVVGWVGNSKWNTNPDIEDHDPKGLATILLPAIELAKSKGAHITSQFADRNVEWLPRDQMPAYYAKIDVLVCASEIEGTPNPVLEAMACGVPVLTTDVGIVREVLGTEQRKYILEERCSEALAEKLLYLHNHRDELKRLSDENRETIQAHSWQSRMPKWLRLFSIAEQRNLQRRTFKRDLVHSWLQQRAHTDYLEWKSQRPLRSLLSNIKHKIFSGK